MLDNRLAPVRSVTRSIRSVHASTDASIADLARLAIGMVEAGAACGLPAHAGQDALEDLQQALAHAVTTRGLAAQVHRKLFDLRAAPSVPEQAFGDDCPYGEQALEAGGAVIALRTVS